MHTYRAKLIRCVDGDTAEFKVDCGFYIYHEITARLLGVNTPERGRENYREATAMLGELIGEVEDEDGFVIIKTSKMGKYGRWLVDIDNVNTVLAEIWPY